MKIIAVLVLVAAFGSSAFGVTFTNQTGNPFTYDLGEYFGIPLDNGASVTFQPGEMWVVQGQANGVWFDMSSYSGTIYDASDVVTFQPDGSFTVSNTGGGGDTGGGETGGGETGGGGSGSSAPLDLAAVASNIVGWLGLAAAAAVALFAAIYVLRLLIRSFQALK